MSIISLENHGVITLESDWSGDPAHRAVKSFIPSIKVINNLADLNNSGKAKSKVSDGYGYNKETNPIHPEFQRLAKVLDYFSSWYPVDNSNKEIGVWKSYFAYMLATFKIETGNWLPRAEVGGHDYFKIYDGRLGNRLGTEDFYNYRGRGFCQLTGRTNYAVNSRRLLQSRFNGAFLTIDLENHPEQALQFDVAVAVASYGMLEGWFTGKSVHDYMGDGKTPDFFHARRVVNGLDRAQIIANCAEDFLQCIEFQYED